MNRCKYCGKKIEPSQDFCGLTCEKQYNRQMTQDQRKIKFFTAGMLAGFLVMLGGVLSLRDVLVAAGIILMGAVVAVFPLTTPETNALLGSRNARLVGRILGVLLIAVGIWVGYP